MLGLPVRFNMGDAHAGAVCDFAKAADKVRRVGVSALTGQQHDALVRGILQAQRHGATGLMVVKADVARFELRAVIGVEDGNICEERGLHHVLAARVDDQTAYAVTGGVLRDGLRGGSAADAGVDVLADRVAVVIGVSLEAEIEVDVTPVVEVGQHHAQQAALALAQLLGALVGDVPQRVAGLHNPADLVAGDVAAVVEYVGNRTLRHARRLGDILDGDHVMPPFPTYTFIVSESGRRFNTKKRDCSTMYQFKACKDYHSAI